MKLLKLLKQLLVAFIKGLVGLALIVAFLFMLIEWMTGCGEHYVDYKGVTHVETCE